MALVQLSSRFRKLFDIEDGRGLVTLLENDAAQLQLSELQREQDVKNCATNNGGEVGGEVLSLYLLRHRARLMGESVHELELLCTALKTWVQRYIEAEGPGLWMTPVTTHLSVVARQTASSLDKSKRSEGTFLKKLVEIHRELFQRLTRERTKRAGYVWVCCELLRAYFSLGQVPQCAFLLSAVSQSLNKDNFNPKDLPKAIAVTFFFFWGKHCVFSHDLRDADERLTWAFQNCPAEAISQRRKILLYLVPCKLRLGVLPTQELLEKYNLGMFVDIVKAIQQGNVRLFTEKMEEHSADFIRMGTYLLMMKIKFIVTRNLCKLTHQEVRRRMGDAAQHKLDLKPFEHVFRWQDDSDSDEVVCTLANLIHQGAVKGYLSHEHRKIVFAKDNPFPPPSKWRV